MKTSENFDAFDDTANVIGASEEVRTETINRNVEALEQVLIGKGRVFI